MIMSEKDYLTNFKIFKQDHCSKSARIIDGVSAQDGKGSNYMKHQDPPMSTPPQFPDSLPKKCSFCNAIGHTERYCFKSGRAKSVV